MDLPPDILSGFIVKHETKTKQKLAYFASEGISKLHCVFDFDCSLTAGRVPGQNVGTWHIIDGVLPPEGVAKHTEIYNKSRQVEIDGNLTEAQASKWWSATLDLITSYHFNIDDIEAAFMQAAKFRDGGVELFKICDRFEIPTVILSAGIKQVIEIITTKYNVKPGIVLSTELICDQNGRVTGWDKSSLIHSVNKREMGHQELTSLRQVRPNIILLGDDIADVDMVKGQTNVIRVGIVDPRKGEADSLDKSIALKFAAGYDLLLQNDLNPLNNLISWLALSPEH